MSRADRPLTILLTAIEPSADAIGAEVMAALRARRPDVRFLGCGGDAMVAAGLASVLPTSELAVMGPGDAALVLFKALAGVRDLAHLAAEERPDAAVLVDAWGFSRLLAPRIRSVSPETILFKIAAPQVWASRPKRAFDAARLFNETLCLLPFEPPLFEAAGGCATYIGNPNFAAAAGARDLADGDRFRVRHRIGEGALLAVLPGSRKGEVRRLSPIFGEAVARLAGLMPGLQVVAPLAPRVADLARAEFTKWSVPVHLVGPDEKFDAFAAASAALAASGTVTTELAIFGVPTVVGYRVGPLTAAWARRVIICDYVSIVNIAAGRALMPELLQEDCTPDKLAEALHPFLTDDGARAAWRQASRPVVDGLLTLPDGAASPADAAAARILAQVARKTEQ